VKKRAVGKREIEGELFPECVFLSRGNGRKEKAGELIRRMKQFGSIPGGGNFSGKAM
jgi:hypothetical protein